MSLRRLGVDVIDLFQLHRIDPLTAAEAQFEELRKLQEEGKVRLIGLSNVSVADIEAARQIVPVATVQNPYNVLERRSEDVLEHCHREGIGFIPYFPVVRGDVAGTGAVADVAGEAGVTASQVALAWLLQRSPVVLPIPGTSQVAHLEENCAAATVALSPSQLASLNGLAAESAPSGLRPYHPVWGIPFPIPIAYRATGIPETGVPSTVRTDPRSTGVTERQGRNRHRRQQRDRQGRRTRAGRRGSQHRHRLRHRRARHRRAREAGDRRSATRPPESRPT